MKKLLISILICFSVFSLGAQELDTIYKRKLPTLNDHSFPSLQLFPNSFINTSLQANMGLGVTSRVKIIGLELDGEELYSFKGQILFLNAEVRYQQRINDWLALFFDFTLSGRIGTNMSTILADGVNTVAGGSLGWHIRIMQSKKLNLSSCLYIRNLSGNFINIKQYFEDIINDVPEPSITKKVPSLNLGAGVQGAYAFNSMFGLQAFVKILYGETFYRGVNKGYFSGGLVGDVDFMPKHQVPVGILLGYSITGAPDMVMTDGGYINNFIGRLGYTGSDEFELGLQLTFYKLELNNVEENPNVFTSVLILKFYF